MTRQFENGYGENNEYQLRDRMMELIRKVEILDSYLGYRVYDIDGIIWNINTYKAIQIENKMHDDYPKAHQELTLSISNEDHMNSKRWNWQGTYLFQYQNTGPDDGHTTIWKMGANKFEKQGIISDENRFWRFIEIKLK